MIEPTVWLRTLILEHRSLEYVIVFFGAVFGGELGLFTLGFLTAQKVISITPVIILSFLGALIPNILWFFIGKTNLVTKAVLHRHTKGTTSLITEAVTKISKGNHFIAITIIKFIVGTPFILVMYVNQTRMHFKNFLYYQSAALILSLLVILPIGFVSGLGFSYLESVFNDVYLAIGFILLIIVIIVVIQLSIKKRFTKDVVN